MSILFHHYKELLECIKEIEEMEAANDSKVSFIEYDKFSTIKEEEEEESIAWLLQVQLILLLIFLLCITTSTN
jgi:hypothetical protein